MKLLTKVETHKINQYYWLKQTFIENHTCFVSELKGSLLGPRQFLTTVKMMKNTFGPILKALLVLKILKFLS